MTKLQRNALGALILIAIAAAFMFAAVGLGMGFAVADDASGTPPEIVMVTQAPAIRDIPVPR